MSKKHKWIQFSELIVSNKISWTNQKLKCTRCGMVESPIGLQVMLDLGRKLNCDDNLITQILDE